MTTSKINGFIGCVIRVVILTCSRSKAHIAANSLFNQTNSIHMFIVVVDFKQQRSLVFVTRLYEPIGVFNCFAA